MREWINTAIFFNENALHLLPQATRMNADDSAQRSKLLLEKVRATILRTRALIDQTQVAQAATRHTLDEAKRSLMTDAAAPGPGPSG